MEVSSQQQPLSQRAYHSASSHYDDDDVMSSNSYNIPASNTSGSTATIEQPETPLTRSSAPRRRVRDMIKLFEAPTASSVAAAAAAAAASTTTPVLRRDSSVFSSSVPYYTGAARGSSINNFGGSQASVKQYDTQLQDADEQTKVNDICRCNAGGIGGKQYIPQFQETEEQNKTTVKCRSCNGTGCTVSSSFRVSQTSLKSPFLPQHQDGDATLKMAERCPRCNMLYEAEEIHYGRVNKKGCTVPRSELECNHGSNKPAMGLKLGPYSSFAESRNTEMLRSSPKEFSQSKIREPCRTPTNVTEQIDGIPVSLAYDSKTTIFRTSNGVRIVIDISLDSMSANDIICSRVETDMPPSRILNEFQEKAMMIMTRGDNHM